MSITNIAITNQGSGYTSEPGDPGPEVWHQRHLAWAIEHPDREFGNERCPRFGTKWLAYKSDGKDSVTSFEPFGWQGSYVWGHTNLGDCLWLYEEFWDWQKDTGAVCR